MKKIKYFITALLLMFTSTFVVNASQNSGIYTDSNNVRWQYRYDNANTEKGLEIAFFDKPDSVTSITIPTLANVKTSNANIASGITKYALVNYFTVAGNTPNAMGTNITNIDFSNVTTINGVNPMINKAVETTITFANSGTIIGEEIVYTDATKKDIIGVFEGDKLNVTNLNKVVSIGYEAFKDVKFRTTNIELTNLDTIQDRAFMSTNIVTVNINTPIIANSVFRDCYSLEKAVIGDRVTELKAEAFMNDANLSVFNFNNITTVGNYAFAGCTLFNIDIYNTKITSIGDAAFMDTIGYLRDLKIPVGVTKIGWKTFYNTGTKKAELNNVTYLGSESFSECKNLADVDFGKTEHVDYRAFYNDKKLVDVTLGDNLYFVGTQAFSDCSIKNLDLKNVERIDYEAFANNQIAELYLPKRFTYQHDSNLFNNNQITKVTVAYDTISSTITENFRTMIGSNYTTITDLILEPSYASSEEIDFSYSKFNAYHTGGCSTPYGYCYGSSTSAETAKIKNLKNIVGPGYFYGLPNLTNLTLKEGYEFIGYQAFYTENPYSNYYNRYEPDDYKLTNVKLPETLKGIGSMAFYGNLVNDRVEINLPQSLELIGYQAFYCCPGVKNAVDLKNLEYLGEHAFMYSGITEMYFRDKLTFIGNQTIFDCKNLKVIVFDCDFYAINSSNDHNFFSHINVVDHQYELIEFTEKVQTGVTNNYSTGKSFMFSLKAKKLLMADCGWTHLYDSFLQEAVVDYLTLPKNLEYIGPTAFYKAEIKNDALVIPDSVTTIDRAAFHSAKLKIDQLPENLIRIEESAFFNSDFHSDPIIPSSVTFIGRSAFMSESNNIIHRNSFTINANLPATVTQNQTVRQFMFNTTVDKLYFGPEVVELPTLTTHDTEFYSMPVKEVIFEGLEYLPAKAFQECTELKLVDFSKDSNLKGIGKLAFYKANSLQEIKTNSNPDNVITLGEEAFRYTGFTSIGKKDSGFDLTSNKFMLDGKYTFSNIANLKEVYVPNNFNDNVVNEYTFWDCPSLEKADIDYNIELIKSFAFAGDKSLKKIFLWGDTEVIQEDAKKIVEATPKNIRIVNNATRDFEFTIKDSIAGDIKITQNDFAVEGEMKVYNYTSKGTASYSFDYPYFINIAIQEKVMNKGVEENYFIVTINDLDPSMFTIPSGTDIYTYSIYDVKSWDEDYALYRRNELFNTDSTYYPLDEVLYLTSNKPEITIKEDSTDFDKSDLIVYALRRDGIVLESDKWKEYTTHFARAKNDITFESYDAETTEDAKIVYDTFIPDDVVDVSTENFASMTYSFVKTPGLLGRREVVLNYVDKPTTHDVNTDIQPVLSIDNVFTGSNIRFMFIVLTLGGIIFVASSRMLKKNKKYSN